MFRLRRCRYVGCSSETSVGKFTANMSKGVFNFFVLATMLKGVWA